MVILTTMHDMAQYNAHVVVDNEVIGQKTRSKKRVQMLILALTGREDMTTKKRSKAGHWLCLRRVKEINLVLAGTVEANAGLLLVSQWYNQYQLYPISAPLLVLACIQMRSSEGARLE
ncbi:hypothetical protein VNO77_44173 [Canavalia gladiata]|uniref:Uncharacterized protein n=1 Tax=Canavalia gladiata TaxID=3824 RepID=A0AAN9JYG1_CANGL